jgi:exodeoxyribonuclease VII large subunit
MDKNIFSVKQVNHYIKSILEKNELLNDVWIKGEISNFTLHRSGHMYFSIKDEGSVIHTVMFKGNARKLRFFPKDGDKVVLRGNISVYEPNGKYQIIIRELQLDGIGSLHIAYEKLKEKLAKEGLFSDVHKKEIPKFPKVIGVVTSPTGAALHDILTTLKRRYPLAKVIFMPVLVQGEGAPSSIINALETLNEYEEVDTLIVGRGGGSIEDLWGFNDEKVARSMFASRIPIISAVGHETDFTIADFVSDARASTPTGAAELATYYSVNELKQLIANYEGKYKRELFNSLKNKQDQWKRDSQTLQYFHPRKVHDLQVQRHDLLNEKLLNSIARVIEFKRQDFDLTLSILDGLSPLKIMKRGYSAVYIGDELVKDGSQVNKMDQLLIEVSNGSIHCTVDSVSIKEKEGIK